MQSEKEEEEEHEKFRQRRDGWKRGFSWEKKERTSGEEARKVEREGCEGGDGDEGEI